ncbi:Uncharacterized protein SCF082_LOCUS11092 [Durusdinium trenchii]|uniref:Uncharacterized protein n=1 Tax=Durusdinium trenchii TaxID=1381693 RepID=A0ABP0JAS4_9DINO
MPEGILVPTGGEYKHQPVQSLRVGMELMDPAKRWKLNVVLQRLFLLGAPKVLIACVLLLALSPTTPVFCEAYEFIELFSGTGWVTKVMKANGIPTASFDILLGEHFPGKQDAMLVLLTILNAKMDNFWCMIGLVCSSWVTISKGTHCREPWAPLGMTQHQFVADGNALTSRACLLILAISAMGGGWLLEQPSTSCVEWHPRVRLLWRLLPEVFSAKWWACMYGAPTAKRHIGWSNCKTIKCLDLGRMVRKLHTKKGGLKSTKTYRNKEGKKSFAGNQHLKGTGTYPPAFAKKLARLHTRFCSKRTLWFGTHLEVDNWELSVHLFEELPWEEADWWPDAAMESVFCYLRGSKDLELGSLRRLFPTHLP